MMKEQLQSQGSEGLPICPSFSSYSIQGFTENASQSAQQEHHLPNDLYDFEFSHDHEILQGQEVYPVFNRELLPNRISHDKADSATLLLPFGKLVVEDRDGHDPPPSSSESESDEEDAYTGKFCVWMPQVVVPASPSRCKKSNSTGSASKSSWKLGDLLLHRSNSDGKSKGNFVLLTPKKKERKVQSFKQQHEEFYVQSRPSKEMQRRKSFLPYRQGLVGFFANVKY